MVKQLSSLTLLICLFSGISAHSLSSQKNNVLMKMETNDNFLEPPNCGVVKNPNSLRIFAGTEVKDHEFPWMVRADVDCGGTLINSRWVLTAAHCYEKKFGPYENNVVFLGAHKCEHHSCDSSAKKVKIIQVISHDKYFQNLPVEIYHDIALLQLEEPVTFDDKIQPICLPWNNQAFDSNIVGKDAIISGWGQTEHSIQSKYLLKAMTKISKIEDCKGFPKIDTKQYICGIGKAAMNVGGGDSGGPLFMPFSVDNENMSFFQIGIVSIGYKYPGLNSPSGYTNVSYYIPWIREKILANE